MKQLLLLPALYYRWLPLSLLFCASDGSTKCDVTFLAWSTQNIWLEIQGAFEDLQRGYNQGRQKSLLDHTDYESFGSCSAQISFSTATDSASFHLAVWQKLFTLPRRVMSFLTSASSEKLSRDSRRDKRIIFFVCKFSSYTSSASLF